VVASLRPRRRELLPRSAGIAEFTYRGHVRGHVLARVELRPGRPPGRSFRVRL
jgi:transcriptional regulator of nitric oxide reductase